MERVSLPTKSNLNIKPAPSLREQWIRACLSLARGDDAPIASFADEVWVSSRKILSRVTIDLEGLANDLEVTHVGYTPKKLADLTRLYLHAETRDAAAQSWRTFKFLERDKVKSVGFHTFNHLVKRAGGNASRDMGPCMNSIVVTHRADDVRVDVSYRSADLFRVFAADLVFIRDVLLPPFDLRGGFSVRVHVASATCHPRDFPFVLANVDDPHREMVRLRRANPKFHKAAVSALAAYLCEERSATNANYDRGQRVQRALVSLMDDETRELLADYCRSHGGTAS